MTIHASCLLRQDAWIVISTPHKCFIFTCLKARGNIYGENSSSGLLPPDPEKFKQRDDGGGWKRFVEIVLYTRPSKSKFFCQLNFSFLQSYSRKCAKKTLKSHIKGVKIMQETCGNGKYVWII